MVTCKGCRRPAVARIHVLIEALDIGGFPPDLLEFAGVEETGNMCVRCMRRFIEKGQDAAAELDEENDSPTVKLVMPELLN